MPDVIPQAGLANLLRLAFRFSLPLYAHQFKNAAVIGDATTLADLVEADYSGYAPILLDDNTDPVALPGGKMRVGLKTVVFAHNGGGVANTVYGYYVAAHDGATQLFLWGGNYDPLGEVMANLDDELEHEFAASEYQEV